MSSAGQRLVAGRVPGERIATETVTADSSTFTNTDTVMMTLVAPLVDGRTYQVGMTARFNSTVSNDDVLVRIREDNVSGTDLQFGQIELPFDSTVGHGPVVLFAEYTAVATGNKTFVCVADRNAGTGNLNMDASATGPARMWVDYLSG
jgi:recombinational DNA repair protein RecT